jgi:phosphate ABC transporter permease protein PstC
MRVTARETGGAVVSPLGAPAYAGRRSKPIDLSHAATGNDRLVRPLLAASALFSGLVVTLVVFFVLEKAMPLFRTQAWTFVTHGGWDTQLEEAWNSSHVVFGVWPLIAGTLLSTVGAVLISFVLGIGCAIFLAELAPPKLRRPVEAVIQLLAGIPSVVFGLVGLSVVVPLLTNHALPANSADVVTDIPLDGASLLAAIIVLSFMIMPFFVTVAADSLRAIPRSYTDGGLALGLPRWRTITRIQLPAATPGVIAGLVLAAARAIGEAIAISMVAGAIAYVPSLRHGPLYFMLMPIRTMASAIVENGGEAMSIPAIEHALFGLAALLLLFSLILSLLARWAFQWFNGRMNIVSARHV